MDKWTKYNIGLSLAFLAVVIGAGIGSKLAKEKIELPSAAVPKPETKEAMKEINTEKLAEKGTVENLTPTEENIASEDILEGPQAYPQFRGLPLPAGVEPEDIAELEKEGIRPEMFFPELQPRFYPAEGYKTSPEETQAEQRL